MRAHPTDGRPAPRPRRGAPGVPRLVRLEAALAGAARAHARGALRPVCTSSRASTRAREAHRDPRRGRAFRAAHVQARWPARTASSFLALHCGCQGFLQAGMDDVLQSVRQHDIRSMYQRVDGCSPSMLEGVCSRRRLFARDWRENGGETPLASASADARQMAKLSDHAHHFDRLSSLVPGVCGGILDEGACARVARPHRPDDGGWRCAARRALGRLLSAGGACEPEGTPWTMSNHRNQARNVDRSPQS